MIGEEFIGEMATSQAAYQAEKAIGHGDNAATEQDVTNPAKDRQKYGDPSGEKMKALVWMGKNSVKVGRCSLVTPFPLRGSVLTWFSPAVETPKPRLIEERDVILKVTGSTVCGSDLHLLHGQLLIPGCVRAV